MEKQSQELNKIVRILVAGKDKEALNVIFKKLSDPEMAIIGAAPPEAYYKIDQLLKEIKYYSEKPLTVDVKDDNKRIKGSLKTQFYEKEHITIIAFKNRKRKYQAD
jgi:hypothetical protein